jgi:hypothetical protein
MQSGHPDTHCVEFNGKMYRVEVVRGESLVGHQEATVWIGRFHRTLSGSVDAARVQRVAAELLRECERDGALPELQADRRCEQSRGSAG